MPEMHSRDRISWHQGKTEESATYIANVFSSILPIYIFMLTCAHIFQILATLIL